jgi:poly(3-hydroxyalkanoate) depolymerase
MYTSAETTLARRPPSMSAPQRSIEYLEIDGLKLRVATQRGTARGGMPLLIFNGIGANFEIVFPFMEALEGKEIIIFDVPGIGKSEMSWWPRRFSGLARLAAKLLDRLGYPEVDVAGVSWGGALAQQFARSYPTRCRRLILAATSAGVVMVPGRPKALSKMITPQRYLSPLYMQRAAGDIYGGETRRDPKIIAGHTARIIPPTVMGYIYQLLAGAGWTSVLWLHKLKQPTLIMAGSDDPLVPAVNARLLSFLIPRNRLFMVQGGGHLFMLYSLGQIIPVIREFLDSRQPFGTKN